MGAIEKIYHRQKLVAIVMRKNTPVNVLRFFTSENQPLQVGIHHKEAGSEVGLHYHKLKGKITISEIHEVFFVQKGKIKVTLATKRGKIIASKFLGVNDGILVMDIAHKVDFLRSSRVFEVKQGPYTKQSKVYINLKK
jgi:oxalate decarboxylase/phosphoglucose isomerase-like protein (cupin superfamily)